MAWVPKDAKIDRSIYRSEHVYLYKYPTCSRNFCGSYYECCLTMHISFSPFLCFKIEDLYFNFSIL